MVTAWLVLISLFKAQVNETPLGALGNQGPNLATLLLSCDAPKKTTKDDLI